MLIYRKTSCPVPPKRQQFCKIHEGDWTRGILFTIFTKKFMKIFMLLR